MKYGIMPYDRKTVVAVPAMSAPIEVVDMQPEELPTPADAVALVQEIAEAPAPEAPRDGMPMLEWGQNLAAERKRHGMRAADLMRKSGVNVTSISGYECGKHGISFENYVRIIGALPALKSVLPPEHLKFRVHSVLAPAPPPVVVEPEAAPAPVMSAAETAGAAYGLKLQECARLKRTIEEMTAHHVTATAEADAMLTELITLTAKG
jgi:hypothetical protein